MNPAWTGSPEHGALQALAEREIECGLASYPLDGMAEPAVNRIHAHSCMIPGKGDGHSLLLTMAGSSLDEIAVRLGARAFVAMLRVMHSRERQQGWPMLWQMMPIFRIKSEPGLTDAWTFEARVLVRCAPRGKPIAEVKLP